MRDQRRELFKDVAGDGRKERIASTIMNVGIWGKSGEELGDRNGKRGENWKCKRNPRKGIGAEIEVQWGLVEPAFSD